MPLLTLNVMIFRYDNLHESQISWMMRFDFTMVILVAFLLIVLFPKVWEYQFSGKWTSITGKVVSSEAIERRNQLTSYEIVITYRFEYSNTQYTSSSYSTIKNYDDIRDYRYIVNRAYKADRIVNKHSTNSDIPVYFNSDNPNESMLITPEYVSDYYLFYIKFAMFGLLVGVLFRALLPKINAILHGKT